jgi:hypothetical protein
MQAVSSIRLMPFPFALPLVGDMPRGGLSLGYDARYEPNQLQSNTLSPGPLRAILTTLDKHRLRVAEDKKGAFGEPPIASAFADAVTFAKSTDLHWTPLPNIHLASDGEVNFLWRNKGIHIDLGFYGNGKFSYYAESPVKEPMYGDDLDASAGMPQELLELFRS